MVVGPYRVFVGDIMTGRILADLPVTKQSWGVRLNDAGPVTATVRPFSEEAAALDLRTITEPVRSFLGVSFGDTVLEAGPIWSRKYDAKAGTLDLSAAGIWSILDRRKAVPGAGLVPGAAVPKMKITIANKSLGGIARELVRISLEDNPYVDADVPIILPPSESGSNTRVYQGYDLGWIGERLRQLTQVQDGPDIRFRPRFADGGASRVEWVMEVGTAAKPLLTQAGADWIWDASVSASGVTGLSVDEDAQTIAAKAWVPGSGQDANMLVRSTVNTTLVDAGYPWTEVDVASKDVEDPNILQGYANQLQAESLRPWETWDLSVRADADPFLGAYLPGDWAVIHTPEDHPILRRQSRRVRIMAVDGDGDASVKLALAPILGTEDALGESITISKPSADLLYPGAGTFPSATTYPLGNENALTYME